MLIISLLIILTCVPFTILIIKEGKLDDWLEIPLIILEVLSGFTLTLCIIIGIIPTHCFTNRQIVTKQIEYESIVKQAECISSEYEDVSKATVIQNIYDWNNGVYNAKYFADNLWTSWFYNQKVVDSLEYINLEDYGL